MYAAAGRGLRRRGVPGTMRASSPTGVCYSAEVAFSRLAAGPPLVVGGGIYPSRGCLRRRGVRRDEGIPPYGRFIGSAYAGKSACFRREECHVGADSISARGVRGGAGLPGTMRASSPTGVCYNAEVAVSRLAAGPPLVRRGGIYPSRGRSRRRGVRRDEGIPPYGRFIGFAYTGKAACFRREECHVGADSISARGVCGGAGRADMESAPTGGCSTAGFAVSRLAACPPLVRRGGIYPSRGCSRRRGVRRDEGIPPYGRFMGSAYTGKAACFRREERHVGADSISARGVRGGAGRADMESAPTGVVLPQGLRFPGWPRALPLVVGEGFIPPAGVRGVAGCGGMRASRPTVVL